MQNKTFHAPYMTVPPNAWSGSAPDPVNLDLANTLFAIQLTCLIL